MFCSLITSAQVYNGQPWQLIPSRTLVLNDYGIRPNQPGDIAKIKQVMRFAAEYGYRVTGYGEFDMNDDSLLIKGVDLWAAKKGSFVLKNGWYFTPKEFFKAENMKFKDFDRVSRGVVFWDTTRDVNGNIIADMWPEKNFKIEVDNVDVENVSNFFYCQQDPSPDSSSITGYIKRVNIIGIRYSGIKLPFRHTNFTMDDIFISTVTNGGANFSAGINIGLDNTFNRGGSYGLRITNIRLENLAPDTYDKTTYGILAYGNGTIFDNIQTKNVTGPGVYAAGINNSLNKVMLFNDSANKSQHGIIVKGGIAYKGTLNISDCQVIGGFGSALYLDHAGDVATIDNFTAIIDEDTTNIGQAAVRILSHGFNNILITGGHFETRQTNSAVNAFNITTDNPIYNLTIDGATIISEAGGITLNSQDIKSFQIKDCPLIYSRLPNTVKTAGTLIKSNKIYYPKVGTHLFNVNSVDDIFFDDNVFKPWYKDTANSSSLGRIYNFNNEAETDSSHFYARNNRYDLSNCGVAYYVQNPTYLHLEDEKLTGSGAANANFINIRFNAGFMDIEAKGIKIPFGKQFITCGLGTSGQTANLKLYESFLTGSVVTFSSATQSDITKQTLVIKGGSVPSSAYGTGWASTDVPGSSGSGDVSSNSSSTTDGYVAVAFGSGAKTLTFTSSIDVANRTSGTLPWSRLGVTGSGDSLKIVHADGVARTPGTFTGITSVSTTNFFSGNGNTVPLSINPDSIARRKYVDSLFAANGGGGGGNTIGYFDPLHYAGDGLTAGTAITPLHPGGNGIVAIKENLTVVGSTTYNITATDVDVLYNGNAATNYFLPAFNSTNHRRKLMIRNNSSFNITLDKAIWTSATVSKTVIAPGEFYVLRVDDTNDKIWVTLQGISPQ